MKPWLWHFLLPPLPTAAGLLRQRFPLFISKSIRFLNWPSANLSSIFSAYFRVIMSSCTCGHTVSVHVQALKLWLFVSSMCGVYMLISVSARVFARDLCVCVALHCMLDGRRDLLPSRSALRREFLGVPTGLLVHKPCVARPQKHVDVAKHLEERRQKNKQTTD